MTLSHAATRVEATGLTPEIVRDLFVRPDIESPTLVLSRSQVAANYRALATALPRVHIHYAVKPNNHPVIVDEVYRQGGNFDVCSAGEIDEVCRTGIDPQSLLHSHPIKSIAEFDYAVNKGVEWFVIDNMYEVAKLRRYTDKKLKVMIRFRIATNSTAVVNLQYKFGCTTDEVLSLAEAIRDAGHEFYGLCFHIGSQCVFNENYVQAIKTAGELVTVLEWRNLPVRVLDIGGGFPVEYVEPVPAIAEFCRPIGDALDQYIRPDIRIVSEPGRFIAATPVALVTTVVGKSMRDGKMWYYLDDGLYSTFSGMLFDHCQYPVLTWRPGIEQLSVLAGPTCDSFDVMYDGLMIPEQEIGDRVVVLATGAYCSVSGSTFNALKQAQYMVID